MKKIAAAVVAVGLALGLTACGGSGVDGVVQSKASHHDKKGDSYTLTVRSKAGKTSTVSVSSKTFKSCDAGETYSKCRK